MNYEMGLMGGTILGKTAKEKDLGAIPASRTLQFRDFGDFRSSFHIPASVKSQIIHIHYKAVTMDSASYEVEINCLISYEISYIMTTVTDITSFGSHILQTNTFVEKSVSLWIQKRHFHY